MPSIPHTKDLYNYIFSLNTPDVTAFPASKVDLLPASFSYNDFEFIVVELMGKDDEEWYLLFHCYCHMYAVSI